MKRLLLPNIPLLIVTLTVLSACQKAGEETESAESWAHQSRRVELDGQSNFRDIGGYKTSDGRVVKWGEVYRSGELHKLSDGHPPVSQDFEVRVS